METTSLLRLVLATLTCFRLAQLIALDNGPLFIFWRFRISVEQFVAASQKRRDSWFWKSVADGLSCPYCLGLYISLLCSLLVLFPTHIGDILLVWFGIMGMQAFLQALADGEDTRK